MGTTADVNNIDVWALYPGEHARISISEAVFLAGFLVGGGSGWTLGNPIGQLWLPVVGATFGLAVGLIINGHRWGWWHRLIEWLRERWTDFLEG